MTLSYNRYCAEIVAQTELLRSCIDGADLTVPVPSCPGWNVGQLLRHVGGAQRWAEKGDEQLLDYWLERVSFG